METMLAHTNFITLALKLALTGLIVGYLLDSLESTLKETPYEAALIALFAAFVLLSFTLVYLELPH